jgi:signal transduction histidine kinase
MAAALAFLARRRWAAVGLAVLVEGAILLPLAYADPSAVVGVPAAVAAAIAGTVAVVFGPLDGAVVALVGAALFGTVGGWGPWRARGAGVWPGIVAAAGLFARRVERQRRALAQLVAEQETERRRIALELHDETAQALAAALLALRHADGTATPDERGAAYEEMRELVRTAIESLRALAVELRPRALDDFGLVPAVERLATSVAERSDVEVDLELVLGTERLPPETEITAYRAVQEVLARLVGGEGGGKARIVMERRPADLRIAIGYEARGLPLELAGLRERVRLAGGRFSTRPAPGGAAIQLDLPL